MHYAEGLSRLFQSGLTQRRRPLTSAMGNISAHSDKSTPCPLYPQSEVGRRIQVCIGCRFMSTRHSERHHCALRTAPPQYVSVLHRWPRWTIFIGAGHSNGSPPVPDVAAKCGSPASRARRQRRSSPRSAGQWCRTPARSCGSEVLCALRLARRGHLIYSTRVQV